MATPGTAERKKVLLADDMASFLELERAFFANEPVDVLTAGNGAEALRIIRRHRPHLVLIDEMMPDLKGHEVCAQVKGDPELRQIPVVIVTAASGSHALDLCMQSGCDGYLSKPVDKGSVLRTAERFLDTRGRRPTRILVRIAHVKLDVGTAPDFFFGYTVDISEGGMRIESTEPMEPQELVDLQFFLPGSSEKVTLRGRVVRVLERDGGNDGARTPEVGLEFEGISPETLAQVSRYCQGVEPAGR